jgi:hypothetical protein
MVSSKFISCKHLQVSCALSYEAQAVAFRGLMQFKKEGLKLHSSRKKMQPLPAGRQGRKIITAKVVAFLALADSLFLAETSFTSTALLF